MPTVSKTEVCDTACAADFHPSNHLGGAAAWSRHNRSVYIKELQATVENDRVKSFRVNVKVSFVQEGS
jgi:Dodecin